VEGGSKIFYTDFNSLALTRLSSFEGVSMAFGQGSRTRVSLLQENTSDFSKGGGLFTHSFAFECMLQAGNIQNQLRSTSPIHSSNTRLPGSIP
jgi:hypothetical protein